MDNLSRFLSFIPCFPLFHVLLLYSPGQLGYNVHFRISVANRYPNDFGYILLHILPWFMYVCSVIFGTSLLSSFHIFNLTRF
jgi:hypothetical protein